MNIVFSKVKTHLISLTIILALCFPAIAGEVIHNKNYITSVRHSEALGVLEINFRHPDGQLFRIYTKESLDKFLLRLNAAGAFIMIDEMPNPVVLE